MHEGNLEDLLSRLEDPRKLDQMDLAKLLSLRGSESLRILMLADEIRRRQVGDLVTFVINRNINYTNVCIARCSFCAFSRAPGESNSYTLSIDQILEKALEAERMGATEVCIQGGLNPSLDLDFLCRMIEEISEKTDLHIHAFSPMEVKFYAETSGYEIREALRELRRSGLGSMPGTAAEILSDDVRRIICPSKLSSKEWMEVIETAHRLGIPTTATMMYGHVESYEHVAKHLMILRRIQERTGGFTEFIPLSFVYKRTPIYRRGIARSGATGIEDLMIIAVSRIYLGDLIPNIQASWVKLGPKLAQIALMFGANDLGGTLMEENISREAGAEHGQFMPVNEFLRIIRDLGRIPAQRDTLYNILRIWR